jgi:hypothetical protein
MKPFQLCVEDTVTKLMFYDHSRISEQHKYSTYILIYVCYVFMMQTMRSDAFYFENEAQAHVNTWKCKYIPRSETLTFTMFIEHSGSNHSR